MKDIILTWKQLPVLLSSTKDVLSTDQFYDFELFIEKNTSVVRQSNIPPQNILYKYARNSAVGQVWREHNNAFYEFIEKENLNNKLICEIGSGNGALALLISNNYKIDCYEPNPEFEANNNVTLIRDFFTTTKKLYDVIILSHTFEHIPDIDTLLENLYSSLKIGGKLIVSVPNLQLGLENNFVNVFNTEHISYFTPLSIEKKFNEYGFSKCRVELYNAHSIFISGVKTEYPATIISQIDESNNIKQLIRNYILNLNNKVSHAKKLLEINNKDDIYIFGCHAMASLFLQLSQISETTFKGIIDNDPLKWGSRLYGFNLHCFNPEIAKNKTVLLNGAAYHEDILKTLYEKNCKVLEWN